MTLITRSFNAVAIALSLLLVSFSFTTKDSAGTSKFFATITVLTPNGGEVLQKGKNYRITWEDSQPMRNVAIFLMDETGASYLIDQVSDTGGYTWKVSTGTLTGSQFKIFLVGRSVLGNDRIVDASDDFFTISNSHSNPHKK